MNISFKLSGADAVRGAIASVAESMMGEVKHEVTVASLNILEEAKRSVPVDQGQLRDMIHVRTLEDLHGFRKEVVAPKHGAFVEFGTRPHTPPYEAIYNWVRRKGIAHRYSIKTRRRIRPTKGDEVRIQATARAIWLSIRRRGTKAHPFLYPAFDREMPRLLSRLEDVKRRQR